MIIPVILSGGSGTRLWPLSRKNLPKQFLPLAGDLSLFQQTVERAGHLADAGAPIVVCSDDHRFLVAEQLLQMKVEGASIILEPAPATPRRRSPWRRCKHWRAIPMQSCLCFPRTT